MTIPESSIPARREDGSHRKSPSRSRQLAPTSALRNLLHVLFSEFGAKLLAILGLLYVAHHVPLGTFGRVSIALATVSYVDAAFLTGMDMDAVRRLSPWPPDGAHLAARILRMRATMTVLAIVPLAILIWTIGRATAASLALLAACTIPLARAFQTRWVYTARLNQRHVAIGRFATQFVAVLAIAETVSRSTPAWTIVLLMLIPEGSCSISVVFPHDVQAQLNVRVRSQ
jgi:O-antigen/teichoic acid export membrane protein